jgi:hypothetical protein
MRMLMMIRTRCGVVRCCLTLVILAESRRVAWGIPPHHARVPVRWTSTTTARWISVKQVSWRVAACGDSDLHTMLHCCRIRIHRRHVSSNAPSNSGSISQSIKKSQEWFSRVAPVRVNDRMTTNSSSRLLSPGQCSHSPRGLVRMMSALEDLNGSACACGIPRHE